MNEKSFGEPMNPIDNSTQNDQGVKSPELNPDLFADKSPKDVAVVQETPMFGTAATIGPLNEQIAHETPAVETETHEAPVGAPALSPAPLLDRKESEYLRNRWNEIQGMFVDEPHSAVRQADALVSEVVEKIVQMFASEHNSLEIQWNKGIDVSTEDLRKALQHYRSFFNRLVV